MAREAVIADAGPLQLWTGRAELGGYLTTGNSETVGTSATLDVPREGLRWRHKLRLQGDYQDGSQEENLAACGRLDFAWRLSPGLSLTQGASAYIQ